MVDSLIFRPLVPLALWGALFALALVLLGWYFSICLRQMSKRRAAAIVSAMALSVACPLAILLNPTWLKPLPPPPDKPLITVLVDQTPSMATCESGDSHTRYDSAKEMAAELMDGLKRDFDTRLLTFSDKVRPRPVAELASTEADKMGSTDLAAAVHKGLEQRRLRGAGLVVLSDGAHTGPGGLAPLNDAADLARALSTPLYTCTIGGAYLSPNLSVSFFAPQELAYIDQEIPVDIHLTHQSLAGRSVNVTLSCEADAGDAPVPGPETRQIALGPNGSDEMSFRVRLSHTGLYGYQVEAQVAEEEASKGDNHATMMLRVIDEPIRVVVLEGKPYWDTKFLLRNLAADPSTEVVSYVQLSPDRVLKRILRAEQDPAAGEGGNEGGGEGGGEGRQETWEVVAGAQDVLGDEDALANCQILVLGRDVEGFLDDASVERVREWVSYRGGSLVCARGAPTAEIGQRFYDLLPVRWSTGSETRFRVGLTDVARNLRSLGVTRVDDDVLQGMPSLAAGTRVRRTKPLTTVLAESTDDGPPRPVISYQPYGSGAVVAIEGAGMWRWAFLPPQHADRDKVYGQVWSSLIRWLSSRAALLPGQDFALAMDKISFSTDEVATATLLVRDTLPADQMPAVRVTGGTLANPLTILPQGVAATGGSHRLLLGALPAGSYIAEAAQRVATAQTSRILFDVRDPHREQLELNARPELMRRLAERSGGAVLSGSRSVVEQLQQEFGDYLAKVNPPQFELTQAWDRPWALLSIFGVWAATWVVRRRSGLM